MADILVRGLSPEIVERLKARARRHGRSLQTEARLILEGAAGFSVEEARTAARRWQNALADRSFDDSADIVRRDRDR